MKLVYLACPYSHTNRNVMAARTMCATRKTAELMAGGYNVFSPLTHSDPVADYLPSELRYNHAFWLARDFQIIKLCHELHVLCLPGWKESFGVGKEIELAEELGLPIVYHGRESE